MRSRTTGGLFWNHCGIPTIFRRDGIKGTMHIKAFIAGRWLGSSNNKAIIKCIQYRNEGLLRTYSICLNRSDDSESIMSGERTILGYSTTMSEDIRHALRMIMGVMFRMILQAMIYKLLQHTLNSHLS